MTNKKIALPIICGLWATLAIVFFFLFSGTMFVVNFWVAFVCLNIAFLTELIIALKTLDGCFTVFGKIFSLPLIYMGLAFAAVQSIVSFIIVNPETSIVIVVAVEIIVLIIGVIFIYPRRDEIAAPIHTQMREEAFDIRKLLSKVFKMMESFDEDDELYRELEALSEKLKRASTLKHSALNPIESKISKSYAKLNTYVERNDEKLALVICDELSGLIDERESLCKIVH